MDSEFCNVESFVTGMVDRWPEELRPRRKLFTLVVCIAMFLLAIPMVSQVSPSIPHASETFLYA